MDKTVPQTRFRAALLDAEQAVPDGLTDGHGRPAGSRFAVYRNNVASSLTEALQETFPAVCKLIGEENFSKVTGLYLRQSPPTSPLMMQYGAGFADFLQDFPPLQHLPYLADVARLEQLQVEVYHAADSVPIDAAMLGELSPEALTSSSFGLAPTLRVLRSDWPVHAIWAFNMVAGSPKPEPQAQNVLITRHEFDPEMTPIGPATASFVEALLEGTSLGEASERASLKDEQFDLSYTLGLMLAGKSITSIKTGEC